MSALFVLPAPNLLLVIKFWNVPAVVSRFTNCVVASSTTLLLVGNVLHARSVSILCPHASFVPLEAEHCSASKVADGLICCALCGYRRLGLKIRIL
mmetsp:Transcript_24077/g.64587  ORF Transcript_24077/g.64587 Transcript_24077/m.64587 type:complete len:96 (+) Transcript_24077:307-594(+)